MGAEPIELDFDAYLERLREGDSSTPPVADPAAIWAEGFRRLCDPSLGGLTFVFTLGAIKDLTDGVDVAMLKETILSDRPRVVRARAASLLVQHDQKAMRAVDEHLDDADGALPFEGFIEQELVLVHVRGRDGDDFAELLRQVPEDWREDVFPAIERIRRFVHAPASVVYPEIGADPGLAALHPAAAEALVDEGSDEALEVLGRLARAAPDGPFAAARRTLVDRRLEDAVTIPEGEVLFGRLNAPTCNVTLVVGTGPMRRLFLAVYTVRGRCDARSALDLPVEIVERAAPQVWSEHRVPLAEGLALVREAGFTEVVSELPAEKIELESWFATTPALPPLPVGEPLETDALARLFAEGGPFAGWLPTPPLLRAVQAYMAAVQGDAEGLDSDEVEALDQALARIRLRVRLLARTDPTLAARLAAHLVEGPLDPTFFVLVAEWIQAVAARIPSSRAV